MLAWERWTLTHSCDEAGALVLLPALGLEEATASSVPAAAVAAVAVALVDGDPVAFAVPADDVVAFAVPDGDAEALPAVAGDAADEAGACCAADGEGEGDTVA